jgi:hypothetical protein
VKTDVAITQLGGGAGANPEFLNELARISDEDKACPPSFAEQLLEERRFEKVMRMTARAFGSLSDVEKRNYTRWAKHLARVFAEKASMFELNSKREPEVPAALMQREAS